ncbi:MAG: hypothetical protein QXR30_03590 [Candidatus Woesearchaeota archaeon]
MELDNLEEKQRIFGLIEQQMNISELYSNLEKVSSKLKQQYDIDLLNINDFYQDEEIDEYLKISTISKDIAYLDYLSMHKDRDKVKDHYVNCLYKSENGIKDVFYYLKKLEENYIKKPNFIWNLKNYLETLDLFSKTKDIYFQTVGDFYDALNVFVKKNLANKYKSKEELLNDLVYLSEMNKLYITSENMLKTNAFMVLYYFF